MSILDVLAGAVIFGYAVAALFFLRFWRRTGDTLFLAFSCAFLLLGVGQGLLAIASIAEEDRSWAYLLRLAAFGLIIAAVATKNRSRS